MKRAWLVVALLCTMALGADQQRLRAVADQKLPALIQAHRQALDKFREDYGAVLLPEEQTHLATIDALYASLAAVQPEPKAEERGALVRVPTTPERWQAYYRIDYKWQPKNLPCAAKAPEGIKLTCPAGTSLLWVHAATLEKDAVVRARVFYKAAGDPGASIQISTMGAGASLALPAGRWCNVVLEKRADEVKAFLDGGEAPVPGKPGVEPHLTICLPHTDVLLVDSIELQAWKPAQ
jgi:hypothetical protein